jgi:hypothetical protein
MWERSRVSSRFSEQRKERIKMMTEAEPKAKRTARRA